MIFFWLGVIAIMALAFVWLGVRLFFRPAIEALAGAARRWSEGDFSARAELKRGPDELLRLAEVFNLMAASFEERERERSRTEESLRKSQTSLEAAQARARIGSWEIDPATQTGVWSPEMYRIFQRDPALGMPDFEEFLLMVKAEDRQLITTAYVKALKTGEVISVDFRTNPERLPPRYLFATFESVTRIDGVVTLLAGTTQDITSRKLAEERLRKSEQRYRALVGHAADAIFIAGPDGRLQEANTRACEMFGYSQDEFIGMPLSTLVTDEGKARQAEEFRRVMGGERLLTEREYRCKDGTVFAGELSVCLLEDNLMLGIARDITARRQAEEALRETTRKLNSTINNLSGFVYRCANDPDYPVEYLSEGVFDLLGYRAEDFVSGKQVVSMLMAPDDRDRVWAEIQTAIETRCPYTLEYRMKTADGEERWVWEKGAGVFDGDTLIALEGFVTDITARKRAEETLQQSELKYRDLTESLEELIYRADPATLAASYVNAAISKIYGYSVAEWLADPALWENSIHADDKDRVLSALREAREKREPGILEYRIIRKDGAVCWVDDRFKYVVDDSGELIALSGIMADITERKRAEAERDRLFNLSIDMMCVAGFDGFFKQLNPAWHKTLGWTGEELLGKPFLEFVYPDDREATINALQTLAHNEPVLAFENRYRCRDGSYRWMSWNSFPLAGEQLIFAVVRDITSRKQAEERLRESEQKFLTAFQSSPATLTIVTLEGKLVEANPAFCKLTGYSREEVIGSSAIDLGLMSAQDREKHIAAIESAGGSMRNIELRLRVRDGSARDVLYSVETILLSGVPHRFGTSIDITERKQAEAERQIALVNEQQARVEAEALRDANLALTRSLNLNDTLESLLDCLSRIIPYDTANVMLREGERFAVRALRGYETLNDAQATRAISFDASENRLIGNMIAVRHSIIVDDTEKNPDWQLRKGAEHVRNWLGVPLIVGGQVIGLYSLDKREPNFFTYEHVRLAESLASQAAVAIQNALLYQQVEQYTKELEQRIEERDRAKEALAVSERRYRSLFEQNLAGVVRAAQDGTFLECNQALASMFGYDSPREVLSHPATDFQLQYDPVAREHLLAQLMEGRPLINIEGSARRKDGSPFWALVNESLIEEESGEKSIIATIVDITSRKQAEAALRESEARLQLFIRHAPASLAMFDRDMRYLAVSRRWMIDYGLGEEDITGRSHYDVFPEIPQRWKEVHRRGLAGEIVREEEDRFDRLDGSVQWLRWEVRPWEADNGEVGGIVIFTEDITSRKQAEEERNRLLIAEQQARREAEEAGERVSMILESITDAFVALDRQWRYTYVNRRAGEMFGRRPEDLLGKMIRDEFPEGRGQPFHLAYQKAMAEQIPIALEDHYQPWDRWFENRIYPTKDGLAIYFHEITERKRAEYTLRHQAAQLSTLHEINLEISSQHNLDQLLQTIIHCAGELMDAVWCAIFITEVESSELTIVASLDSRFIGSKLKAGEGLAGKVALSGQTISVEDYSSWEGWSEALADYDLGPSISVPLLRHRDVIGVISLSRRRGEKFFSEDDAKVFERLGAQAAIAIHQARLFEEIRASRERLQLLSRQLIDVQEKERRALARELHDEIGQVLTAVKINLQTIQRLHASSSLAAHLDESVEIVGHALGQVRNMSLDLRPSMLDDFGLAPALRWYIEREAQRAGIEAQVNIDPPDLRATSGIETVCFRVAQEAMTNIARHAQARRVKIELKHRNAGLQLSIEDDGRGFDVEAVRKRASEGVSLGILGMEERVLLAGGQVEITSSSKGSRVCATFPDQAA